MRLVVGFVALLGITAAQAEAKDDEIAVGPPPKWASPSEPMPVPDDARGPIFVRQQDVQMHLDRNGQKLFLASRFHLADTSALQLGNVSLSWNPAAGSPIIHAVKVHRAGTARDVLASTKFEVLRREDQLETAIIDGMLTATLRVPDLRVGDDLELAYTLPAQDPTLLSESSGFLYLAPVPPPGRLQLRLSWDSGQEPTIRATPDMEGQVKREALSVSMSGDNLPAQNPPKDAPPRYSWQRLIEFSDFSDWQGVSRRIAPLFTKAATLSADSAIKQEAATIAAGNSDQMNRASAALKLVQQQVRYVFVGLAQGGITPASAEETWQRRYGDCKGKTVLLLALLKELGIPAEAVLVSNAGSDDGMAQRLPNPFWFDHVLVRAQIDGQTYWLDGTLPHHYRPSLAAVMPYRAALPLDAQGKGLEAIGWQAANKPTELALYEIDARAGFDEPAKIRSVTIKRGPDALVEYHQFSAISDNQLETSIRQEFEGSTGWNTVDKVKWRFDSKELASIFEIEGTGPINWDNDGGKSRSLSLPGGGFSPPDRRQRGGSAGLAVPFYIKPDFDCRATTVRLPSATAAKDWSFNSAFDTVMYGMTFRRSFEKRDGAIRMIRSSRTLQVELDPEVAAKDNQRLPKFDNSMAWIYYDPASYDRPGPRETVPATYEGDWLADSNICLTPAKGGQTAPGVAKAS